MYHLIERLKRNPSSAKEYRWDTALERLNLVSGEWERLCVPEMTIFAYAMMSPRLGTRTKSDLLQDKWGLLLAPIGKRRRSVCKVMYNLSAQQGRQTSAGSFKFTASVSTTTAGGRISVDKSARIIAGKPCDPTCKWARRTFDSAQDHSSRDLCTFFAVQQRLHAPYHIEACMNQMGRKRAFQRYLIRVCRPRCC